MKQIVHGVAVLALLGTIFTGPAMAADDGERHDLVVSATIDGVDLARADGNRPVRLQPGTDARIDLLIENAGEAIRVHSIRIDGRVLGLAFFSYEVVIGVDVDAGATVERSYDLDLFGLGGQATGLIPARMHLVAPDRSVLTSVGFVAEVDGSLRSVYGLFGLAVAGFTALTLIGAVLALARQHLSRNRFRRGLQFLAPGIGLGLTATFTLSALRLVAPGAGAWAPLTLGCGAALFAFGYLTPSAPDDDDVEVEFAIVGTANPEPSLP